MPAQRESCRSTVSPLLGAIFPKRGCPRLSAGVGSSSHPAQAVDHAVFEVLWGDPLGVLPLTERGQALFPGTHAEPRAPETGEERLSAGRSGSHTPTRRGGWAAAQGKEPGLAASSPALAPRAGASGDNPYLSDRGRGQSRRLCVSEKAHIASPAAGTGGSLSPGPSYFPICHLAIGVPSRLTNARCEHEEITSMAVLLLPYPHLHPSRASHETFSFSALYLSAKAGGQELLPI